MTITEFEIPWVTGNTALRKWEINSIEDFYREFPKDEHGQVILGMGLHLIIYCSNGYYLPIGNIATKKDYNKLKSWGIPMLKDFLNDNN